MVALDLPAQVANVKTNHFQGTEVFPALYLVQQSVLAQNLVGASCQRRQQPKLCGAQAHRFTKNQHFIFLEVYGDLGV